MTAVIRVKRRITEEPLGAVIINCKRRKTTEDEAKPALEDISAVLKFAGTIHNQHDNLTAHLSKITKEEAKETFKKHIPDITSKLRTETRKESQKNRFKVVNCSRALEKPDEADEQTDDVTTKNLTVVDIEANQQPVKNVSQTAAVLEDESFVYDLYYSEDVSDMIIDNMVSVHPFENELNFGNIYRNANGQLDSSDEYDSEDSNDENNYKNDYPDSDNSINEADMMGAVKNCSLGDDLSDDEGEEGFVYSIDSEAAGFEEDVDDSDVLRYGERYARYKARAIKQLKEDSDEEGEDISHEDYYDDDDDDYNGKSD